MPSNLVEARLELAEIRGDLSETISTMREFEMVASRLSILIRRYSGDTDLGRLATKLLHAITVARMLQRALIGLNVASGGLGWINAGLGIATAISSGYTVMEMY